MSRSIPGEGNTDYWLLIIIIIMRVIYITQMKCGKETWDGGGGGNRVLRAVQNVEMDRV